MGEDVGETDGVCGRVRQTRIRDHGDESQVLLHGDLRVHEDVQVQRLHLQGGGLLHGREQQQQGSGDDDMFEDIVDITEEGLANNDPATVAQTPVRLSKGDQIKAFFAGLREVMCDGAEAYVEQVESWEKQYRFLERLM